MVTTHSAAAPATIRSMAVMGPTLSTVGNGGAGDDALEGGDGNDTLTGVTGKTISPEATATIS
jgi:hypothetical protein